MALAGLGEIWLHFPASTIAYFFSFLGLIFPYKFSEFFEGYMSDELIKNYRDDLDFQNLIDSVQQVK